MELHEHNKDRLRDALRELPSYEPPDHLWQPIQRELEEGESRPTLERAIGKLPEYEPPERVWISLQDSLQGQSLRSRKLRRWYPAAAAALLVGVIFTFWKQGQSHSDDYQVTTSYSVEFVDQDLLAPDWEEDEAAFALVEEWCAQTPLLCSNPDLQLLQRELQELTSAKETLVAALDQYGNDPDLIGQLAEIELERTSLLKQMLERMI